MKPFGVMERLLLNTYFRILVPMALTLAGCEAHISTIVAKPGYYSDPHRVFIVDDIDPIAGKTVSMTFRAGMRDMLARCGITSAEFKFDALELNRLSRYRAEVETFHPDLLLRIETRHIQQIQYTEVLTYWVGAWDPLRDATHEVWSARISAMDVVGTVDRDSRGTEMAEKVIKQMTKDGMLPACAVPLHTDAASVAAGTPRQ
jgi:hypothetical protein